MVVDDERLVVEAFVLVARAVLKRIRIAELGVVCAAREGRTVLLQVQLVWQVFDDSVAVDVLDYRYINFAVVQPKQVIFVAAPAEDDTLARHCEALLVTRKDLANLLLF